MSKVGIPKQRSRSQNGQTAGYGRLSILMDLISFLIYMILTGGPFLSRKNHVDQQEIMRIRLKKTPQHRQ